MSDRISTPPAHLRLLLVDDDPDVVETVRGGLDANRFSVEAVSTVTGGRDRLTRRHYDAMILDVALPDGSGLDLADAIRAADRDLPILMLTAKTSVSERLDGFRHGADDYLCKPFAIEELEARLNAILRRVRSRTPHVLTYADVELDLLRRVVRRGNLQSSLSARETNLLAYLINHAGQPLPRARILEEIWGDQTESESNVVNVYVNYLRNKLERGFYPRLIHTVRGVGYILTEANPEDLS